MTMVEKVALALKRTGDQDMEYLRDLARAAIEAMREPTEAVLETGPGEPYMDAGVWAKMIDAALKD